MNTAPDVKFDMPELTDEMLAEFRPKDNSKLSILALV